MKNCPNCGSPIDPYRVKCEYCGTMYFDWATWMMDGEPCYINYGFKSGYGNGTIAALAIPELKTIEVSSETNDMTDARGNIMRIYTANRTCELDVRFRCVSNPEYKTLFKMTKNT